MINSAWANERQELLGRIARMEQLTRRIPSRFAGGGASAVPNLFRIQGGNTIPGCQTVGIQKRTDTVLGSELPAGSGGTGVVIMPAFPIPVGLPNGVGVARRETSNDYVFALNDATSGGTFDLPAGQPCTGYTTVNLDRVVGPITYRYVCFIVAA